MWLDRSRSRGKHALVYASVRLPMQVSAFQTEPNFRVLCITIIWHRSTPYHALSKLSGYPSSNPLGSISRRLLKLPQHILLPQPIQGDSGFPLLLPEEACEVRIPPQWVAKYQRSWGRYSDQEKCDCSCWAWMLPERPVRTHLRNGCSAPCSIIDSCCRPQQSFTSSSSTPT